MPHYLFGQSDSLKGNDSKWIIFGKDRPDSMVWQSKPAFNGYFVDYRSDSIKRSEGMYLNNKKSGVWTFYFKDGKTISHTETYLENRLEGPYEKFYPDSTLKESGYYENGKRRTRLARFFPSGCLEYEAYYNESGREEGVVKYYYDCDSTNRQIGQIEFEYRSVSGVPVGFATRYFPNGNIKEVIEYGPDGRVVSREIKD